MKGHKVRHLLGVPKAPNKRRQKNRDTYLFNKSEYLPSNEPCHPTRRERRLAKLTYN